jgi:hypothetical protein
MEGTMAYVTNPWAEEDERTYRDIASAKRVAKRKIPDSETLGDILEKAAPKKIVDEESQVEIAKLKKELGILQKQFTAQTDILKAIAPTITRLDELHSDAVITMERDTLDDVYGIGQISAEFKKLRASIEKLIPKEYKEIDQQFNADIQARIAEYKARQARLR